MAITDRHEAMKWQRADGHIVDLRHMTDKHIVNLIKYLENNAERIKSKNMAEMEGAAAFLQGEDATFLADQEIWVEQNKDPWEHLWETVPQYWFAICVAHKRGLYPHDQFRGLQDILRHEKPDWAEELKPARPRPWKWKSKTLA